MLSKLRVWAGALVVGLLLGTVATFGHQSVISAGPLTLPWGIVVALLGVACYLAGLRLYFGDRWAAVAGAVGIMVPIVVFGLQGPGGSVVVPEGTLGQLWVYGPAVIALLVLAWPALPARRAETAADDT